MSSKLDRETGEVTITGVEYIWAGPGHRLAVVGSVADMKRKYSEDLGGAQLDRLPAERRASTTPAEVDLTPGPLGAT